MVLSEPELTQAVSKILLRSERVVSVRELQSTYVDTGVLPQLDNDNNQIVYGRRGTGKSHVLRVLGATARSSRMTRDVYVDLRYLGSTQQATDPSRPFPQRCFTLFKDFLIELYDCLLETATDPERSTGEFAIDRVESFGQAITRLAATAQGRDVSLTAKADRKSTEGVKLELSAKPSLGYSDGTEASAETSMSQSFHEVFERSLIFSDLRKSCEQAVIACGLDRLLILIDEWTVLPPDVQPFFAEFLKRTFLPSPLVTIKIASLEYRSRFSLIGSRNQVVGFELGGDISANIDLDDYYVYDRNSANVTATFQEVLYRHIVAELPPSYVATRQFLSGSEEMRKALFTERDTFVELVRAAEGVVRDFISIFNRAFFVAQRRGRLNIDVRSAREAARQWYETDKAINLSEAHNVVLQRIMTDVIGAKKARSFLLERKYARHPMVESLFDFRVLHVISKGYSDRDNPGLRYNIYGLDYGTYVDLIHTKSQPELDLIHHDGTTGIAADRVVPFDDRRSIRRVIVSPEILDVPDPGQPVSWGLVPHDR